MEGLFITFEGGEGAGKTTLIEKIAHLLGAKGLEVVKTREPGGTELGEKIRDLLLHRGGAVSPYAELCLFLSSRAQHIFEVIAPAIRAGKVVLCDRFNDSSVAYQGAARGLGVAEVSAFCNFISEGLKPHLTLYLDLSPELGLGRAAKDRQQDRIESEKLSFHHQIRKAYLSIHESDPARFRLINATLPRDQVFVEAVKFLEPLLEPRSEGGSYHV